MGVFGRGMFGHEDGGGGFLIPHQSQLFSLYLPTDSGFRKQTQNHGLYTFPTAWSLVTLALCSLPSAFPAMNKFLFPALVSACFSPHFLHLCV